MFKKPLGDLKTSAPLRSSDRRKLKQRIADTFGLSPEDAQLLVPEGLKSVKFENHQGKPGVAYLSHDGDPLWFTLGKGSDDLIPTVYSLWKKYDLLATLTTPQAVMPRIQDGADLMIPGVVSWPSPLSPNQLVSISKYVGDKGKRAPPFAVGRVEEGVDEKKLGEEGAKGKAVGVLHAWKDGLWSVGHGGEMPPDVEVVDGQGGEGGEKASEANPPPASATHSPEPPTQATHDPTNTEPNPTEPACTLTPDEITQTLRTALLLSLTSPPPPGAFPMPASTFYTSHVLPYRPAHLASSPSPVDVKHSSLKSLSAFLKSCEKAGLVTLKNQKGDIVVTSVNSRHEEVLGVGKYKTVKDVEEREKKKREREAEEERGRAEKEVEVREYYKPFGQTLAWFAAAGQQPVTLFLLPDLRALLNAYIASHNLVNPHEQHFVNVSADPLLLAAVTGPLPGKPKGQAEVVEFLKREEIMKRLVERMQAWYEIRVDGREGEVKKGALPPITLTLKSRQNKRKTVTIVTGLEPFAAVVGSPEEVAEGVRRSGFGASVSAIPNKPNTYEILVQGKQQKVVMDLLLAKGVPKRWIEVVNLTK